MTPPNSPRPSPAIEVHGLQKRFGELCAIDDLDLELRPAECLGLLGPNGAGKSTTVRILSTLTLPDRGDARVLGFDLSQEPGAILARIGVVPQELALYGHLSGAENLAFFGRIYGLSGAQLTAAVERGLDLAGLTARAGDRVRTYSGGMKRRLNIAAALLHDPELVFLDEPTVGIDPQSKNRIFAMVEGLRSAGKALLYTSHQLGEVERLCDRIIILDHGRKVAEGTLAELQEHERVTRTGSALLHFAGSDEAQRAAQLLEREGLAATLVEERPGLEQIFLDLTGHALRDEGGAV